MTICWDERITIIQKENEEEKERERERERKGKGKGKGKGRSEKKNETWKTRIRENSSNGTLFTHGRLESGCSDISNFEMQFDYENICIIVMLGFSERIIEESEVRCNDFKTLEHK